MGKRCPLKVVIEEVKKTLGISDHIFCNNFISVLKSKNVPNLNFLFLSVKKKTK